MNNVSRFVSLADDDLDQVIGGGLSYEAAKAVYDAYTAASRVTAAVGLNSAASFFNGAAQGVSQTFNGHPA